MGKYKNKQISDNLNEVADIMVKVCANTGGIKLTVSALDEEVMTVCSFSHVLDCGEEFSFFYTSEVDAMTDQKTLCNHLRIRGVPVVKLHKQERISIKKQ